MENKKNKHTHMTEDEYIAMWEAEIAAHPHLAEIGKKIIAEARNRAENNISRKSRLTESQVILYEYLKFIGDRYISQYDIALALPDCYQYNGAPSDFHDSAARIAMTGDIRALNESPEIEKLIISNKNGVKIANAEESAAILQREHSAAVRKINRARTKAKKAGLDAQIYITDDLATDAVQAFTEK